MKMQTDEHGLRVMHVMAAGTVCRDVSSMGAQNGLFGPSCRPLAVWMAQLRHMKPVPWCFFFLGGGSGRT